MSAYLCSILFFGFPVATQQTLYGAGILSLAEELQAAYNLLPYLGRKS